jgi:3-oxoacyl-[acyl-carrier protein] reductase
MGDCFYLVHAATIRVPNMTIDDLGWKDVQSQIDIHVKAFFDVLKELKPVMAEKKYGKVVTITTQAVEYPFSNLAHYTTAKAALQGFNKSMALDLARYGIRINMVSPGITDTDLNADLPEKARLLAASKSPLKRLVKPEDVAGAIAYLLSEDSDHLTGETIRVNGGQVMI